MFTKKKVQRQRLSGCAWKLMLMFSFFVDGKTGGKESAGRMFPIVVLEYIKYNPACSLINSFPIDFQNPFQFPPFWIKVLRSGKEDLTSGNKGRIRKDFSYPYNGAKEWITIGLNLMLFFCAPFLTLSHFVRKRVLFKRFSRGRGRQGMWILLVYYFPLCYFLISSLQ